jgi:hypothetical protein
LHTSMRNDSFYVPIQKLMVLFHEFLHKSKNCILHKKVTFTYQ